MRLLALELALLLLSSTGSALADDPVPQRIELDAPAVIVEGAAPTLEVRRGTVSQAISATTHDVPSAVTVEIPEDATPETREWLEHVALVESRRLGRGGEVGGVAMFGLSPGGLGDVPKLEGVVDGATFDLVARWNGSGALVVRIVPGSPAETAGLQPGDVVVKLAGLWIDSPSTLVRIASRATVGDEYEVRYLRGGLVETTWLVPVDRQDLERR